MVYNGLSEVAQLFRKMQLKRAIRSHLSQPGFVTFCTASHVMESERERERVERGEGIREGHTLHL